MRCAVFLVVISAVVRPLLWGQGGVGTIVGRVTYSSGAVRVGAVVEITKHDTGVSQATMTSSEGTYIVPYLNPEHYSTNIRAAGFAVTKIEHVHVQVDHSARMDATLKPGANQQQVVVFSQFVGLDTETADIGEVVTQNQVSDLPLNGREFTSLMLLQPGAVQLAGSAAGEQSIRPGEGDSLALRADRASGNQYLVDGVSINDIKYQTPSFQPSIDAIQEFKAQTKGYSAEYGSSANQINVSCQSGTNQVHGTAYDFIRNQSLGPMDARDPNLDYSVSSYNIPQRFISSFIDLLPVGRGKRFLNGAGPVTDRLFSGWQLNAITTFQSRLPQSVLALDIEDYNEASRQRANIISNPYPSGFQRTVNEWFNTAAFANPP
jgi:hypothetical protein